jgi:NADH-ubiquinone oxidoreductase chain 5
MYLLVLILPLLSSVFLGFFGVLIGVSGAIYIALTCLFLSSLISLLVFYEIFYCGVKVRIELCQWFDIGTFETMWTFLFDSLTSVMLLVVLCISFLVHLYSVNYMEGDPHFIRFLSYLSLFTFFMLLLVTSDNFLQIFLGWEGVGVSSYLLINFWYTRIQANKAALKAIILNRFGDFFLLLGILLIFFVYRSINFGNVFSLVSFFSTYYIYLFSYEIHVISLIVIFLFFGAVGKSAQLGLHTWLPDAMEGPTPVSALIHAATMVTAGVFLLLRSSLLLEYSFSTLSLISIFGGLTAFFAATVGIFQNDLKRVIAYSTCSQLGYMVFACGLSNYSVAVFHLMNHAFFKALLFLSAGGVIHGLSDEQDMRRMGGLFKILPLTFSVFIIGSLALMGFPFTTGFYSKDVILEVAYSNYYFEGIFCYWLGVLGACCTAFYSFRLLYLTFLAESNFFRSKFVSVHDVSILLGFPLIILGLGSIFVGFFFKDLFIGLGSFSFGNSFGVFNSLNDVSLLEAEFISVVYKVLPVILSIFFGIFAYIFYYYFGLVGYIPCFLKHNAYVITFYFFFSKKWFFDLIYNSYFSKLLLLFGKEGSFQLLDRGIFELIGPTGLVRSGRFLGGGLSRLQTGFLYHYIFLMSFSLMILCSFVVFSQLGGFLFFIEFIYIIFFGILWQYFIINK